MQESAADLLWVLEQNMKSHFSPVNATHKYLERKRMGALRMQLRFGRTPKSLFWTFEFYNYKCYYLFLNVFTVHLKSQEIAEWFALEWPTEAVLMVETCLWGGGLTFKLFRTKHSHFNNFTCPNPLKLQEINLKQEDLLLITTLTKFFCSPYLQSKNGCHIGNGGIQIN